MMELRPITDTCIIWVEGEFITAIIEYETHTEVYVYGKIHPFLVKDSADDVRNMIPSRHTRRGGI